MHIDPVLQFDEEDSQLRFDEASRRLILIKHQEFVATSIDSLPPIRCELGGRVENVRFSLNHRLAAVQRSATEIEFIDLLLGNNFVHRCKGCNFKGRWRILSYQWTGKPYSDFLVITTAGVEFYLVLPHIPMLKLVKTAPHTVAWCVYSHDTRLLLLATGAQDNVIQGIQIQPQAIVRIPRFEVQLAPLAAPEMPLASTGQQKVRRSLQPQHLSVVRLYNMILCAHVEPERQQVLLYQLFKDFVVRKYALSVYSRQIALSVSDNLLIVHALDAKVALIFDVKINSQYPVTAPLPVSMVSADGGGPQYSPHWEFFPPDFVIDPQAGTVGRVSVDVRAVAASSVDTTCLLQFLLARAASQEVVIEVLASAVSEQMPLSTLSGLFGQLQAAIDQHFFSNPTTRSVAASSTTPLAANSTPSLAANSATPLAAARSASSPPTPSVSSRALPESVEEACTTDSSLSMPRTGLPRPDPVRTRADTTESLFESTSIREHADSMSTDRYRCRYQSPHLHSTCMPTYPRTLRVCARIHAPPSPSHPTHYAHPPYIVTPQESPPPALQPRYLCQVFISLFTLLHLCL